MVLFSHILSAELALGFAGVVLSCDGAPGKELVMAGCGSDDLLSSTEPVVDVLQQSEGLQVRLSPHLRHCAEHRDCWSLKYDSIKG